MHHWDDDWTHWKELYRAQEYLCTFFYRCAKKHLLCKEKYGAIRYEYSYLWAESDEDCRIFREAIMRTVRKFPDVAGEICNDAGHVINDEFFNGWCAGVYFKASGGYWWSSKRPNGV